MAVALIIIVLICVFVGAALLWAVKLPSTWPRPRSRYRGHTFTTVDRELRQRRRE